MCKVSVIIPVYNVAEYVERCVSSVINQTLKEIEIIIINDGSTDNTLDIITSITDKRIKIINKRNNGVSSARNDGIAIAKGEYILFLDGDDWVETHGLKEMHDIAVREDLDVLITNFFLDYEFGKCILTKMSNKISGDFVKDALLGNISFPSWNKLFKKSLIVENYIRFPEDVRLGEDLCFNMHAFLCTQKIKHIEDAYVHYFQRNTSASNVYDDKMYDNFKIVDFIVNLIESEHRTQKYKEELLYFEYMHTYFYVILRYVKETKMHKDIYDKTITKYPLYLKNPYIRENLRELPLYYKIYERAYRYNYWLGRVIISLIKNISQAKKYIK